MRKLAVITGASSGIGAATSSVLINNGFDVLGISRSPQTPSAHLNWIQADLRDREALPRVAQTLLERCDGKLDVLVHSAGRAYFAPHEELSPAQISEMLELNLLAPLLLTNQLLRALKASRGSVVFLSSASATHAARLGGVYAATKAGIRHFSSCLFEEVRKSGVQVITITPDITDTPFYDHLRFKADPDPQAHLTAEVVAESIRYALAQPEGVVVNEIVLRPQIVKILKKDRHTES